MFMCARVCVGMRLTTHTGGRSVCVSYRFVCRRYLLDVIHFGMCVELQCGFCVSGVLLSALWCRRVCLGYMLRANTLIHSFALYIAVR